MAKPYVEWRRPTCYRRWPDRERYEIIPGKALSKHAKFQSTRHLLVAHRLKQARELSYWETEGSLWNETEKALEAKLAKAGKGIVLFLDAGAGKGGALPEAEKKDKDGRVNAWGLSPRAPRGLEGRWVRGHFETVVVPGTFHVIQSRCAIQHAAFTAVALENMLNSLAKPSHGNTGGTMVLGIEDFLGGRPADDVNVFRSVPQEALLGHSMARGRGKRALEERHPALVVKRILDMLKPQGFEATAMIEKTHPNPTDSVFEYPRIISIARVGRRRANLARFYDHPDVNAFLLKRKR